MSALTWSCFRTLHHTWSKCSNTSEARYLFESLALFQGIMLTIHSRHETCFWSSRNSSWLSNIQTWHIVDLLRDVTLNRPSPKQRYSHVSRALNRRQHYSLHSINSPFSKWFVLLLLHSKIVSRSMLFNERSTLLHTAMKGKNEVALDFLHLNITRSYPNRIRITCGWDQNQNGVKSKSNQDNISIKRESKNHIWIVSGA